MVSSLAFSLTRKPFFPTTFGSFGTFYGQENRNIIRSFKVAKPWHNNYMLDSKEIPKCGHRLSFFISCSTVSSGREDFPNFVVNGSNVEVKVSSAYTRIDVEVSSASKRNNRAGIYFMVVDCGSGDCCVKNDQKVKIHYQLYDKNKKVLDKTYPERDPEIIGPGENKICQGLYEGIVGMQVGETRRIVLPPSSVLTGEHSNSWFSRKKKHSEEHRIYDVYLVEIIG